MLGHVSRVRVMVSRQAHNLKTHVRIVHPQQEIQSRDSCRNRGFVFLVAESSH